MFLEIKQNLAILKSGKVTEGAIGKEGQEMDLVIDRREHLVTETEERRGKDGQKEGNGLTGALSGNEDQGEGILEDRQGGVGFLMTDRGAVPPAKTRIGGCSRKAIRVHLDLLTEEDILIIRVKRVVSLIIMKGKVQMTMRNVEEDLKKREDLKRRGIMRTGKTEETLKEGRTSQGEVVLEKDETMRTGRTGEVLVGKENVEEEDLVSRQKIRVLDIGRRSQGMEVKTGR